MERIDDLQRNGCRIIQRPDLFCFGTDAVFLACWAEVKRGDHILDLCSGNGVVPILMDARLPDALRAEGRVHFTGVEINSISVDLAKRSVLMNGQSERIAFLEGDIRQICRADDLLRPSSFDSVTVNPPYITSGGGLTCGKEDRMVARHEMLCTIDDVAAAANRALKQGGHLYMVHRPHRLGDVFDSLSRHHLAVKRIRMVHPFADREANLVLIDAAKGGRAYVHVDKPLVIYQKAGEYTEEVKALYG